MKLKVGIIGLGVGEAHIKGYVDSGCCEIIALCDFDQDKISAAKKKYGSITIADNADSILENADINIVSVASYDNYHFEQVCKAISHNKHVFVEKPLCLYENEAFTVRNMLNEKPWIRMSSNLILRKCPRFFSLKDKIQKGEFGNLFHIEGDYNYGRLHKITEGWRGKIDFYSVLYGGGVHIVDLFLWLANRKVVEVSGFGNNIASKGSQFKFNDSSTCILKFDNGMTGKVSVHYGCVRPHFHGLSVFGTKATFVNNQEYGIVYNSMDPGAGVQCMKEDYPGVHKGDLIISFINSIVNDSISDVTIEDVFNSMSVCFAMEKAINTGKIVKVNYI